MKNTLFILIAIIGNLSLLGQNPNDEIKKLISHYQKKTDYHYALSFDFFVGNELTPHESMRGESLSKGGKTYYKLNKLEVVTEKGLIVVISHEDQYVLLDKEESETAAALQDPEQVLRHISKSGKKMTIEASSGNKKALKIFADDHTTVLSAIVYDAEYNIEKMITHYDKAYSEYLTDDNSENTKLELSISPLPLTDLPLKFSTIIKSGLKYQLTPAYQKYQFINRLSKEK